MKTIAQYRTEIEAIDHELGNMREVLVQEDRNATAEERARGRQLVSDIEELEDIISAAALENKTRERVASPNQEATAVKPDPEKNPEKRAQEDRETFSTFGEQMQAVMLAGMPEGRVDPRLRNTRAVTGMSEGIPSDGGFLVQTDFSTTLMKQIWESGDLAGRCKRIPISGRANSIKINGVDETSRVNGSRMGGIQAYWQAEASEKTKSKPKFRQITLDLNKLIGLCYATDELLDDAAALASIIQDGFRDEFNFKIQDGIINGLGAGQLLGILNAGSLVSVTKETGQAPQTVVTENIVKMYSRLFAASRGTALWLVNQNVEPELFTMTIAVGTGGSSVYMPPGGLSQSPYGSLLGIPVRAIEQCQTIGTVGDIYLADFNNGYLLAEKGGLRSDFSIHVRFIYDEGTFRFVLRIDGQPVRATALTPYKGGANFTQSHFIALQTRS